MDHLCLGLGDEGGDEPLPLLVGDGHAAELVRELDERGGVVGAGAAMAGGVLA
jgi:hypothetical protein